LCFSGRTVGINTKTPQATLDVDGNAIIRSSLQVNGSASITGNISFGYSTLPTLSTTSLGYTINYTNAAAAVLINLFTNSAVISVPVGVYMVGGYAIFTPSSSAQYQLRLGINTVTGAFNSIYNYTSDINPASTILRSIHYSTILNVSATTNFYFVFATSIAGTLGGTLKGKFVRIA
jgi:hypothetical protein